MDADLDHKSSTFSETRAYTDAILFNEAEIGKIKSCSVFIYDAPQVNGTYFLVPFVNKAPFVTNSTGHKKVAIAAPAHSVTIIKIKLSPSTPITSYSEVVSLSEFEKYYEKTKWLRKKFDRAGYFSVRELVDGYTINNEEVLPSVRIDKKFISAVSKSKMDTVFYSEDHEMTYRDSAKYYSIIRLERDRYYSVKRYFIASNQLEMTGHYTNIDSEDKEGPFLFYNKSGRLCGKGTYHKNKEEGFWEYYYDTLNAPLLYTCNYIGGEKYGKLISYYPNGKIKRNEYHQIAAYNGHKKKRKSYPADNDAYGTCYDEQGKEIKYTPFEIFPKPAYNYNKYLQTAFVYPRQARLKNIEGRVIIKFTVSKDGTIKNVRIIKSVYPDVDQEAARVISQMPPWQPGIQDDKAVDVVFTLPVVFKLH